MVSQRAENEGGLARLGWGQIALFLAVEMVACGVVPALGFWLVFGDADLMRTALISGFLITCCTAGILLSRKLRASAQQPPNRD